MTIGIKLRGLFLCGLIVALAASSKGQQQLHESQVQNLVNDLASKGTITAAQQESYIYGNDTGTANAYAVTLTPAPTIVAGSIVAVKIANTNTGTATLSVNGSGTTTVTTVTSGPDPTPPPPTGSTTVVVSDHNLDDETTPWKICAVGACGGGTPGGTNSPASYGITFAHSSPSTDGDSALIQQTTVSGAKQTNILFIHKTGVCPNCTWVHTHKRLYVDSSGGTPNNVEADSMHEYGGKFRMYGVQCNLTKHFWQIANDVESWQTTPISCAGFTMNAWHEIEAVYHTDNGDTGCGGNGCLHYDWIAFDGVEHDWNLTRPSDAPNNWANGDVDQFQCDIAGGSKTCKIYIDDAWFESGTGTPPSGTISSVGTGGGGGGTTTTTTTTTTGTTINKKGHAGLVAGDLVAGQIALFIYEDTSASWQLINPSSATSTGTSGTSVPWFQEIPTGTMDGTNTDFYLTHALASPYMILMENGVIQDPYTRFTASTNHINMAVAPLSTDELVAWYFPGSADGQRSSGDPPVGLLPTIRGTGSGAAVSGSSTTIPWPSGTVAGDFAVIFAANAFSPTCPSGWAVNYNVNTLNWNVGICSKVLNSGDISTGHVTVLFAGTYGNTYEVVTFMGGTGGVRETIGIGSTGAGYTLTTSSAVSVGDMALYFGSYRDNSGGAGSGSCTVNRGTLLQQVNDGIAASSCLYGEQVSAAGALSATFLYSYGGDNQEAIVIVQQ